MTGPPFRQHPRRQSTRRQQTRHDDRAPARSPATKEPRLVPAADSPPPQTGPPDTDTPGTGTPTASTSAPMASTSAPKPRDTSEAAALGRRIAEELSERQAEEIVLMDIAAVSGFTDYFVIASATSSRQFEALAEAVERAAGDRTHRREGSARGGWQLFDFGDVVVHIFGREERAYYNLEGLWSAGRQILHIE